MDEQTLIKCPKCDSNAWKFGIETLSQKQIKEVNNNRLERQWSDLKTAARPFRGFKREMGIRSFVASRVYRHNYFMPNKRLNGKTLAQAVGKKLPYCHDKLKLMMKFL
jgi:hypothetical protein